ncbi:MAG: hypothetical protein AAFR73_08325 [Pseudomonadota bacterium]
MLERTRFVQLFAASLLRFRMSGHEVLNRALMAEGRKLLDALRLHSMPLSESLKTVNSSPLSE